MVYVGEKDEAMQEFLVCILLIMVLIILIPVMCIYKIIKLFSMVLAPNSHIQKRIRVRANNGKDK